MSQISLIYDPAELQGGLTEAKLTVKDSTTNWHKLGSTSNTPSTNKVVTVSGLSTSLNGIFEFALGSSIWNAIKNGNFDTTGTWDGPGHPGATDDAEILGGIFVTVPNLGTDSLNSLVIDRSPSSGFLSITGSGNLTIGGGGLTVHGTLNLNSKNLSVLTVNSSNVLLDSTSLFSNNGVVTITDPTKSLIFKQTASTANTGITKVAGNVVDSVTTGPLAFHGALWLTGTGAQSIG